MNQQSNSATPTLIPNLKSETALYIAILALAACVRLYRLGVTPLSADEAAQALAAWHGAIPPPGASPVLYAINSGLFALLGAGDGLARLGAALFGTLLAGAPFFLRHRLGRIGALGAACALAILPTAIIASRTLSGEIVTPLVGLGLLAAGERYRQTLHRKWRYALAALLALGLIGGSSIYALALIFVGGLAFWRLSNPQPPIPNPQIDWKYIVIIVVAGVVGVSTVLLWRPVGLGAVGDLAAAWLRGFRPDAGATWWYLPFQILIFYDALALLAGLAGLIIAVSRGDWFGIFLGWWVIAALIVTTLRQGRAPQDMILVVAPLACLAGYAIERLAQSFRRWPMDSQVFVSIVAFLVILALGVLALAYYAVNPGDLIVVSLAEASWTVHRVAILGFLAVSLLGVAILLQVGLMGTVVMLRDGALAVLIVLALGAWSTGWDAAQLHPGDPRELLSGPQPTSPSMRQMIETLKITSDQQTGHTYTLPLVVVTQSSAEKDVLEWTLRDFSTVQFVSALDETSLPYAVIAPFGTTPALASSYAGQKFALYTTWSWGQHTGADLLRWVLYRWSPDAPLADEQMVVWIQEPAAAQTEP